ncbi:phosphodiester glycosidase family protein [Paenibacillus methanolicus]|uniref:Exopolysaccharide biosynthesis protein n=1 Tax=Paenibacillus methanolicus TaxID=582686 RepID=A0A5S5BVY0_9BACL|nr:phosphodiester glycosidase family protein [Paenibacillus methanolicus]TYP71187.1 exopolysaccharide biosynthesis protein [Paenibacillus methanolicus]
MAAQLSPAATRAQAAMQAKSMKRRMRKRRSFKAFLYVATFLMLIAASGLGWLFLTPSGTNLRYLAADSLIITQHRHWAKYIIGQVELDKRVAEKKAVEEQMGVEVDTHEIVRPAATETVAETVTKPLVEIEEISGTGYKGHVMIVNDSTKIRLGVPAKQGRGERVRSMVERTGAVAGVNAGGFADPNWQGNGFQPIGVVISRGEIFYSDLGKKTTTQIVGLDYNGKMIAGRYSLQEMKDLNVREAVSFQPRLIVNGKGLIKNAKDGWGIAPRTAMGQREDGAIIFVVIDGRQPGHSIGANLYDVQNIMLEHGAVIAANLDGGSSTVLVKDDKVLNRPSTKSEEGRYLPTAFLVFNDSESVDIPNVWAGLGPGDIDGGRW